MLPFTIAFEKGRPAYEQVVYGVKKAILSGQLRVNDRFPSVRQLSVELRINPNTAQKVIAALQQEGLLDVIPGVGTVVAKSPEATRDQRQEILGDEVERLVVEAKRLSLELTELQQAVARHWKRLEQK